MSYSRTKVRSHDLLLRAGAHIAGKGCAELPETVASQKAAGHHERDTDEEDRGPGRQNLHPRCPRNREGNEVGSVQSSQYDLERFRILIIA